MFLFCWDRITQVRRLLLFIFRANINAWDRPIALHDSEASPTVLSPRQKRPHDSTCTTQATSPLRQLLSRASPTCLPYTLRKRPPLTPLDMWQLQREISFVDKWLTSHVSDHSGLNHRKNIFSALAALSPGEGGTRLRDDVGR